MNAADLHPLHERTQRFVLEQLPDQDHARATELLNELFEARGKEETARAVDAFVHEFQPTRPQAARELTNERRVLEALADNRANPRPRSRHPIYDNVLAALPEQEHARAEELLTAIFHSGGIDAAREAVDAVVREFETAWPTAASEAAREGGDVLAFLANPGFIVHP